MWECCSGITPESKRQQAGSARRSLCCCLGRTGTASLVAAPKRHTYGEGGTIAFRVNFTEPVVATGIPTLPISIGDTVR